MVRSIVSVSLATQKRIFPSLCGVSLNNSLAIVYAPLVGIRTAVVGVLAVLGFFNILGEELGWRGFLQDALRPLPRGWRYLPIGILWEFWHFTNRTHGPDAGATVRGLMVS